MRLRHQWEWSGNLDGKGTCRRCSLRTKSVTRKKKRPAGYRDTTTRVAVYAPAGSNEWTEKMPACRESTA